MWASSCLDLGTEERTAGGPSVSIEAGRIFVADGEVVGAPHDLAHLGEVRARTGDNGRPDKTRSIA
jgi:hypothetical protein